MDSTMQTYHVPCPAPSSCKELVVDVPGSKSITNRALLLATMAAGTSVLDGVLFSDDSRHFLKCIQDLGFHTEVDEPGRQITVTGLGGAPALDNASLYVGSAGTAARFLTAYLGVSSGIYQLDASPQMRKRPMAPLLHSLKELGCNVTYRAKGVSDAECVEGHFPFTLQGHGFGKSKISVNIDESSQFLSALLIASILSPTDFSVELEGEHGLSYIRMTAEMMKQFGVTATPLYYCKGNSDNHDCTGCINSTRPYAYSIPAGQHYKPLHYRIEPDVSAACYFYAMSPLLGIPVTVRHVHSESLQGDIAFLHILEQMGCGMEDTPEGIRLTPPADGVLKGLTADLSAFSDQAITLAALAPFANSPVTITGIGHIRYQESNRILAIVTELQKLGIRCEEAKDRITIYPGVPVPGEIETYEDHRMAMGFSLIGLKIPGIAIKDPLCCRKTFENYFDMLDHLFPAGKDI